MGLSHEYYSELANDARKELSIKRGYEIYPDTPVCGLICTGVKGKLEDNEIEVVKIDLPDTDHYVLIHKTDAEVFDPQFKQFIPQELRGSLPNILIFKLTENSESEMVEIGFPENIIREYLNALRNILNKK